MSLTKLFLAGNYLVSDIPAGDGKFANLFLQRSLFIRLSTALYLVHAALGVEAGRVWAGALCVPRPALLLQQLTHQALNRLLHLNQRKAITFIEKHKKLLLF
jgi:hypothetical protein